MKKPHIKKKKGKWYLWRERRLSGWSIPVVVADTPRTAFNNFVKYERFN